MNRAKRLLPLGSRARLKSVARWLSPLCLAYALPLAGCKEERAAPPPATVDENVGTQPGESLFFCQETVAPLAADGEAPASWVKRVAPVLETGEYQAQLSFQESLAGHTYSPGSKSSALTLNLSSIGPVEVVLREAASRDPARGLPADLTNKSLGCVDTLRVVAQATFTTADGSLNEAMALTLEAQPSGTWIGQAEWAVDSLDGNFTAELNLPEGFDSDQPATLRATLGLLDRSLVGDLEVLSGELLDPSGETRHGGVRERFAHFPSGNFCGPEYEVVTLRQLERRTAVEAALARLNSLGSVALVADEPGSPEGELGLSFRNVDDTVCLQSPNEVAEVLLTHAELTLSSTDQRIDGVVVTDVVVLHEPQRVVASASVLVQQAGPKSEATSQFGIADELSLEDYSGVSVELTHGYTPEGSWGSLQVVGLGATRCLDSTDAGAPEPAPQSDAGTEFDCNQQRLWAVHWGQSPD